MNKQLRFSWGHIIAFLALIFISYVTFMGITYLTDGDFTTAVIGVIVIILLLLLIFIGPQILKSTDKKFKTKIWFERIFIFFSPIVFILIMIPYGHFWTVYNNNDAIVKQFSNGISTSKQMFTDYDDYSSNRIENYDKMIMRIVNNKNIRLKEYSELGFNGNDDNTQRENKVEALRIQLRSENYDSLKYVANKWIDSASGASVWNVFLLGNIKQIKSSIQNWYNTLVGFSEHKLTNEEYKNYNTVTTFDNNSETIKAVHSGLEGLNRLYVKRGGTSQLAITTSIICYLMLLFPYLLQDRCTKSTYTLTGSKFDYNKSTNRGYGGIHIEPYDDEEDKNDVKSNDGLNEDEYDSFTI